MNLVLLRSVSGQEVWLNPERVVTVEAGVYNDRLVTWVSTAGAPSMIAVDGDPADIARLLTSPDFVVPHVYP